MNEGKPLNDKEQSERDRIVGRYERACKKAHDLGVALLIDAEESWIQDTADDMALRMMRKYNKNKAVVFNTVQTYRWGRMAHIRKLNETASLEKFKIGLKVVRDAYLEKENERAKKHGYKSPICRSKQATDENFDAAITYMMEIQIVWQFLRAPTMKPVV